MGTAGVQQGGVVRRAFTALWRAATYADGTRPGLAGEHLNEIYRNGRHVGRNPFMVGIEAALRGLTGQHVPHRGRGAVDEAARAARRLR